MANAKGIDISHWQGNINFALVPSEYKFVYMKASEGTGFVDDKFVQNYDGFVGRYRAPYHFWRYSADPAAQAAHWRDTVGDRVGEWGPVADLEDKYAPKGGDTPNKIRAFLDAAEHEFGVKPLIYTGAWWWDSWVMQNFSDYGLLIANYKTVYPWSKPYMPRTGGWSNWLFWQHSATGQVPGINASVDLNMFNGDDAALAQFMGVAPTTKITVIVPVGVEVEVIHE
jgi:lysozyme